MAVISENITVIGKRPSSSFHKRYLKFDFILGADDQHHQKTFSDGKTVLSLEYFRATVSINYQGGDSLPECQCSIYNLDETWINQLTMLGLYQKKKIDFGNYLIIYASTDNSSEDQPVYTKIFEGGITVAYVDYGSNPDVIFHVNAMSAAGLNLISAKSISFKGPTPVDQVMQSIINNYNASLPYKDGKGKLTYKNYGVRAVLNNPNYHGDLIDQIRMCTKDTKSRFAFQNQICYIFPENNSLNDYENQQHKTKIAVSKSLSHASSSILRMSTDSGMIGYPAYADHGITVRCIFNRTLRFGEEVFVQSIYPQVTGVWKYMISLQHELSCQVPNGSWYTSIGLAKTLKQKK